MRARFPHEEDGIHACESAQSCQRRTSIALSLFRLSLIQAGQEAHINSDTPDAGDSGNLSSVSVPFFLIQSVESQLSRV